MKLLLDSLGRALLYCLHPRVMLLSLLPLFVLITGVWVLAWLFWEPTTQWVLQTLDANPLAATLIQWLESWGLERLRAVVAPAVILFVFVPLMVIAALLAVAVFMVPAMVALVANRRFPDLEKKRGGGWLRSVLWSLGSTLLALMVTLVTMPLWLFPPLAVIIPPLIWGWLTYRVMSYDALALHATVEERRAVMLQHRYPLLGMGIVTGCLGAAPALLWATGAMWVAMAPIVVPVAIWLYTLTFAFAGLWFAHYTLAALQLWRTPASTLSSNTSLPPSEST